MININETAYEFGSILFSVLIDDKTLYIYANDYNVTSEGLLIFSHFGIKPTIIKKWDMVMECNPETQEECAVLYMQE